MNGPKDNDQNDGEKDDRKCKQADGDLVSIEPDPGLVEFRFIENQLIGHALCEKPQGDLAIAGVKPAIPWDFLQLVKEFFIDLRNVISERIHCTGRDGAERSGAPDEKGCSDKALGLQKGQEKRGSRPHPIAGMGPECGPMEGRISLQWTGFPPQSTPRGARSDRGRTWSRVPSRPRGLPRRWR